MVGGGEEGKEGHEEEGGEGEGRSLARWAEGALSIGGLLTVCGNGKGFCPAPGPAQQHNSSPVAWRVMLWNQSS